MKDLYAQLGIGQNASDAEIMISLRLKPQLSHYGLILLNQQKRAIYDRAYTTQKLIGVLRHRLDLDPGDFWFFKNYSDFSPSFTASASSGASDRTASEKTGQRRGQAHEPKRAEPVRSKPSFQLRPEAALLVGGLIILAIFISLNINSSKSERISDQTPTAYVPPRTTSPTSSPRPSQTSSSQPVGVTRAPPGAVSQPQPQHSPQPLPQTGWGYNRMAATGKNFIDVKIGPGSQHTWVKIEDWANRTEVAARFARAGTTVRIELPLGKFRFKTASGSTWYGTEHLFGSQTAYAVANSDFPLNELGEYWTVELIPQTGGNLTERKIDAEEF